MKVQNDSDAILRLKGLLARLEETDRSSKTEGKEGVKGAKESQAVARPQDEIQLSQRAREMERLRDEVANSPEVRQALVDQLREEISSGNYRIDGTKIADAILKENLPH